VRDKGWEVLLRAWGDTGTGRVAPEVERANREETDRVFDESHVLQQEPRRAPCFHWLESRCGITCISIYMLKSPHLMA
jgi:hypothetical protein